jgi:hypothetical protein
MLGMFLSRGIHQHSLEGYVYIWWYKKVKHVDGSCQIGDHATEKRADFASLAVCEALINRQKLSRHGLFLLHTIHNPRLARVVCTQYPYTVIYLTASARINIPSESDIETHS